MQKRAFDRRSFMLALSAGASLSTPLGAWAAEPLVVVVGSSSKLRDIDHSLLRRVFLNRPTPGPDGTRFVPLNHKMDMPARVRFDRAILGLDPDEVQRYWVDQKIRGLQPPRTIAADAVAQVLSQLPGTISYLPAGSLGKLRALTIDGRSYQAKDYPLR